MAQKAFLEMKMTNPKFQVIKFLGFVIVINGATSVTETVAFCAILVVANLVVKIF